MIYLKICWICLFTSSLYSATEAFEFAFEKTALDSVIKLLNEITQSSSDSRYLIENVTAVMMQSTLKIDKNSKLSYETINQDNKTAIDIVLHQNNADSDLSFDHILNLVQFEKLQNIKMDPKRDFFQFKEMFLNSYEKQNFKVELDKFVSDYEAKNFSLQFSNLFDDAANSTTLKTVLLEFAIKNINNPKSSAISSPNKFIYDYHAAILLKIYESNFFLFGCRELQNQLSSGEIRKTLTKRLLMLIVLFFSHSRSKRK